MNFPRVLKYSLIALLIISVLGGCSSNKEEAQKSPVPANETAKPAETEKPAEPVTITYESWSPAKPQMDKILEEFKKVHPEITVEVLLHANFTEFLTAIKTGFATGEGPDVFQFDSPTSLSALKSQMEPMDEFALKEWGADWKSNFLASPLADVTLDGKTMGLPQGITPGGLIWYNKTVFDKYGIKEPKTYAELKSASDTLRTNGMQPLLLGAKDSWIVIDTFQAILNDVAPGKQYDAYAKKIPFTDPEIIKAFDTWKQMFDDKIFQDDAFSMTQYMDVYNAFVDQQKGAMESNGAWNLDIFGNVDLKAKVDAVEWGVMPFPDLNGDGKLAPTLSTVGGTTINKNSKHKEAAWELVKFMSYEKGFQVLLDHFLFTPPFTQKMDLTVQLSPNAAQNREQIGQIVQQTAPVHRGIDNAKVAEKMYDVLTKVAYGQMTSADAAKEVQAVIDAGN